MIICLLSKSFVLTPHLNRLVKTVQMRGPNIWIKAELKKLSLIITKYSLLSIALLKRHLFQKWGGLHGLHPVWSKLFENAVYVKFAA